MSRPLEESVAASSSQVQQKDTESWSDSFASFTSEPGQAQTCLVERLEWKDSFSICCGAIVRCGLMKPFDIRKNRKQMWSGEPWHDPGAAHLPVGQVGPQPHHYLFIWSVIRRNSSFSIITYVECRRIVTLGGIPGVSGQQKEPL